MRTRRVGRERGFHDHPSCSSGRSSRSAAPRRNVIAGCLALLAYPLPKILFTTCFVQGFPLRVGRASAFKAEHTC